MAEIRRISAGDRAEYIAMAKEFYSTDAVLHPLPDSHFERTFEELMRSDEYAQCFIFFEGAAAAGYALLAKTFSQEAGGAVCWVEELYVRPEHRGKGIGKAFLEGICAGDFKRLRLEVEDYNTGAIRLYERCGFKRLGYMQMFIDK